MGCAFCNKLFETGCCLCRPRPERTSQPGWVFVFFSCAKFKHTTTGFKDGVGRGDTIDWFIATMFSVSTGRYYLFREPADMRKSFDSLCGIVQNELQRNPSSGDVFIFINKPRNRIKLLHWERGGYLLYYKRLESGTLEMPEFDTQTNEYCIPWHEMVMMVEGISVKYIKLKKRYMSVLTAYC